MSRSPFPPKVLVMDDEPLLREVMEVILKGLEFEATLCSKGEEALELFDQALASGTPYRLVILDLSVPGGMGGLAVVRELRGRGVPFIAVAMSGYSDEFAIADPALHGFDAALPKPFLKADFLNILSLVPKDEPLT